MVLFFLRPTIHEIGAREAPSGERNGEKLPGTRTKALRRGEPGHTAEPAEDFRPRVWSRSHVQQGRAQAPGQRA